MSAADTTVVAGAGPAGLTAAWELARLGRPAVVLEKDDVVGGISRTVEHRGYRFDVGGHRFFTKVPLVREVWSELLDGEMLERPRLSRIYYGGAFFDYPLRPLRALVGLGPVESLRVAASYAAARLAPKRREDSFEDWVSNRFGRRLFEIFFATYTEKVWGIPCDQIDASWAAQRIKDLDLLAALKHALKPGGRGGRVATTLIDRFHYPRLGPGQMWERCRDLLAERGVETRLGTRVVAVHHAGGRVTAVTGEDRRGGRRRLAAGHFVSSMPLPELVRILDPPAPPEVAAAAGRLRFRDFLTVVLIVDRAEVFPDNWIYVHSPDVRVGRVQNFKNWSPDMVPDAATTALGLEYFVQEGDELWAAADDELAELAAREMERLGLARRGEVVDSAVVRMPKAYPVYDQGYREALPVVRDYLGGFENLHAVGRNGQHRYNNQDHSMLTGIYAARNVAGAAYDLWSVNVEAEYHEEIGREAAAGERPGDRLVPRRRAPQPFEALLREAFARYHPVALGTAVGTVAAAGLFLATAVLLLRGGEGPGPNLGLLAHYLVGFEVTWTGALVGAVEAGAGGYLFGDLLARAVNRVIGWSEAMLLGRLELARTLDPLSPEE
ncbi:MAG TPA: NAD(P)/FAD-dependent oxidoreductase [Thermoanaerobaculia bacterium]